MTDHREYPIEFSDVPGTLRDRWQALVEASELPLYRTATLNLIAVTTPERLAELRDDFEKLVTRQPCRAFFLVFDRAHPNGTNPTVSYFAGVETRRNARSVRYERLTFRCDSDVDLRRVESLIRPLILDDLPTILLTQGPAPCSIDALRRLARSASLHVFDSANLDDAEAQLTGLRSVTPNFRDLAWLRLTPWRRALARAFEHLSWNPDVHGDTKVTIQHADTPGARSASTLLSDWLRERLRAVVILELSERQAAPTSEPDRLVLEIGPCNVVVAHCCERPRIHTRISLEDRCLVPFETPASRGCRGSLVAAAADGA